MQLKDFIKGFVKISKDYIEKYEHYKELTGIEKKQRVDGIVLTYCNNALDTLPLNLITKWIFKKFIIANIPLLTQAIFDLIASKIDGITK